MALGLGGALVGAITLYSNDPTTSALFPPCPVFALTGLMCPGCGTLRALHALMHGDIGRAWAFNPLLVVTLPLFMMAALMAFDYVASGRRWRIPTLPHAPLWALLGLMTYMVGRNL